jgi:hypothetical protein
MAHYLTDDDKYRDLIYGDDYRSPVMARSKSPDGYKFGRTQGKRFGVHARRALRGANSYLRSMVEAIANSKLRRMERELELRGIRLDRPTNDWMVRKSEPAERS